MSHDLLFNMADQACARAWDSEGWGPYHKRLLTMCIKIDYPGRRTKMNTIENIVLSHIKTTGSISIREAMDDYGISGGTLTKSITLLKRKGNDIRTIMKKHPITGRRYARYSFAS